MILLCKNNIDKLIIIELVYTKKLRINVKDYFNKDKINFSILKLID